MNNIIGALIVSMAIGGTAPINGKIVLEMLQNI